MTRKTRANQGHSQENKRLVQSSKNPTTFIFTTAIFTTAIFTNGKSWLERRCRCGTQSSQPRFVRAQTFALPRNY